MKIKQENGSEIEVFTQEEFDAKSKEIAEQASQKAIEEYKAQNPDQSEKLNKLEGDLKKAEEDLSKALAAGGNEEQIKRLRKERDEAKAAAEDGIKSIKKEMEDFKKDFLGSTEEEMLNKLSNGDKGIKDKIKFEFDRYNPGDTTKKGITERMKKAYQIVTGNKDAPDILDGIVNAGNKGFGQGGGNDTKIERTPNEVKIGAVLGVNNEDVENYEKFKAKQNK